MYFVSPRQSKWANKIVITKQAGRDRCGVEGTQRAVGWMSGDHDRCFLTLVLEAFRQVFFNTNALPRITIGADVWGESDIMTGVY